MANYNYPNQPPPYGAQSANGPYPPPPYAGDNSGYGGPPQGPHQHPNPAYGHSGYPPQQLPPSMYQPNTSSYSSPMSSFTGYGGHPSPSYISQSSSLSSPPYASPYAHTAHTTDRNYPPQHAHHGGAPSPMRGPLPQPQPPPPPPSHHHLPPYYSAPPGMPPPSHASPYGHHMLGNSGYGAVPPYINGYPSRLPPHPSSAYPVGSAPWRDAIKAEAQSAFFNADCDASGYLDVQEFYNVIRSLVGSLVSYQEALQYFAKTDTDKNGRIGMDEFVALYMDEIARRRF